MNPRLSLMVLCILFATPCFSAPSNNSSPSTTGNQPQPTTTSNGNGATTPPATPTTSDLTQGQTMADFCRTHTC